NIYDPNILGQHLKLELLDSNQLLVTPIQSNNRFFVDGKLTTSKRIIETGQSITIGKTNFSIISYHFQKSLAIKDLRNEKLAQISKENSDKWSVLKKIQNLMV